MAIQTLIQILELKTLMNPIVIPSWFLLIIIMICLLTGDVLGRKKSR